jgi:hypothetical protein
MELNFYDRKAGTDFLFSFQRLPGSLLHLFLGILDIPKFQKTSEIGGGGGTAKEK